MSKLKLIVPVRSTFMMNQMLDSGADEIYLGLKPEGFKNLSFDSRYQAVNSIPTQVETVAELDQIVNIAHDNGKTVNFMVNSNYVPKTLQIEFTQHIDKALESGIDRITVSNLTTLHWVKNHNNNIPIDIGSFMAATNIGYFKMLESLGVERVGIPQGMCLSEIEEIAFQTQLKLIVTGNFGGGNVCGHCRLSECPTDLDIGQGCRSGYNVIDNTGNKLFTTQALDGATDCSLCSIPDLINMIKVA